MERQIVVAKRHTPQDTIALDSRHACAFTHAETPSHARNIDRPEASAAQDLPVPQPHHSTSPPMRTKPPPSSKEQTLHDEHQDSSISPPNTESQITHNASPLHHQHEHTTPCLDTLDTQASPNHASDNTTVQLVLNTPGGNGRDDNQGPRKCCAGVCFLDRLRKP
jgi:hypothetical protein